MFFLLLFSLILSSARLPAEPAFCDPNAIETALEDVFRNIQIPKGQRVQVFNRGDDAYTDITTAPAPGGGRLIRIPWNRANQAAALNPANDHQTLKYLYTLAKERPAFATGRGFRLIQGANGAEVLEVLDVPALNNLMSKKMGKAFSLEVIEAEKITNRSFVEKLAQGKGIVSSGGINMYHDVGKHVVAYTSLPEPVLKGLRERAEFLVGLRRSAVSQSGEGSQMVRAIDSKIDELGRKFDANTFTFMTGLKDLARYDATSGKSGVIVRESLRNLSYDNSDLLPLTESLMKTAPNSLLSEEARLYQSAIRDSRKQPVDIDAWVRQLASEVNRP